MIGLPFAHLVYNGVLLALGLAGLARARRRPSALWLLLPPVLVIVGLPLSPIAALPFGVGPFGMIGLFAWAVFVHLPLAALGVGVLHRRRPLVALPAFAAVAVVLAVAFVAFLVEPQKLELNRITVESAKVAEPLRIAILADIQTDDVGEHERRAVELAMAEEPDLVLLPGDFVQVGPLIPRRAERAALNRIFREVGLDAPLGAFAVRGNIDPDGWPQTFEGTPVRVMRESATVETGGITVTGLDLFDSFDRDYRVPEVEGFHVVFGHAPDFALGDVRADLLVAGHCHGGQVTLPFVGPLLTLSRVPRSWVSGATEVAPGRWLVVSRGIGMERAGAPPLRFRCPPEVVIVDVVPAEKRAP